MREEKCRLDLGNACYHSLRHLLCSRLLCEKVYIEIHGSVMLPAI